MSSQTLRETAPAISRLQPASLGPILVATDGTDASIPALMMARLLAGAGAELHILSVLEPFPAVVPPEGLPVYSGEYDAARGQQLLEEVGQQARDVLGESLHAPVVVRIGGPVETIARAVREQHARMVITGRRHHGRMGRLLHGETPLAIARASGAPVLVVPRTPARLPRVAIIAMDLDDASVNSARRARPLLAEVEKVHVVHVRTMPTVTWQTETGPWEQFYRGLTHAAFERVVAALDLPATVQVETNTLTGHPVEELLEFADFINADLIVSGYRKRLLIDRITGPRSVAERVFRATACAMLLVPETLAADQGRGADVETETVHDPAAWPRQLAAFTYRNAHRIASLEIDTLDLGAQGQVAGYPLLGIDYDEADGVVHVMLGAGVGGAPHLMHAIHEPRAVEIYRHHEGKDIALRVTHEGGYTLMSLHE